MTKGPSGSHFHAIDQDKIPVKDIAAHIGGRLGVPTKSIARDDPMLQDLGFVGLVMGMGGFKSAKLTKEWTGWQPSGPGLFKAMEAYSW